MGKGKFGVACELGLGTLWQGMVGYEMAASVYEPVLGSGHKEVMYKNPGDAFLVYYYCGAQDSSGASKTSLADGISPTKSWGGEPAACIYGAFVS